MTTTTFLPPSHHVYNIVDRQIFDVKDYQSELTPPHQKELDALLNRTKEKYTATSAKGTTILPVLILVRLPVDFKGLATGTSSSPAIPSVKGAGGGRKCHQQNLLAQKERKLQGESGNIDPNTGKRRRGRPPTRKTSNPAATATLLPQKRLRQPLPMSDSETDIDETPKQPTTTALTAKTVPATGMVVPTSGQHLLPALPPPLPAVKLDT